MKEKNEVEKRKNGEGDGSCLTPPLLVKHEVRRLVLCLILPTRRMCVDLTHSYPVARQEIYFVNIFFVFFRDISFLYDVKYVKGEARESSLCPPRLERSLQSHDGVIVPHKVNKVFFLSF